MEGESPPWRQKICRRNELVASRETRAGGADLIVDEGGEGEVIEEVGEEFPDVGVAVFTQTFVVETVNLSNLTRFVIPSEDRDAIPVADLHRDEEGDRFDGVVTSIDVVSHEEVIRVGGVSSYSKEF